MRHLFQALFLSSSLFFAGCGDLFDKVDKEDALTQFDALFSYVDAILADGAVVLGVRVMQWDRTQNTEIAFETGRNVRLGFLVKGDAKLEDQTLTVGLVPAKAYKKESELIKTNCTLGQIPFQFNQRGKKYSVGVATLFYLEENFYVPPSCLTGAGTDKFNFWVALNNDIPMPALVNSPEKHLAWTLKFMTFFTPESLKGKLKHAHQCFLLNPTNPKEYSLTNLPIITDSKGCAANLTIKANDGIDVGIRENIKLASNVAVYYPPEFGNYSASSTIPTPVLADREPFVELHTRLYVLGRDDLYAGVSDLSEIPKLNALQGLVGAGKELKLSASICAPDLSTPSGCAGGQFPLYFRTGGGTYGDAAIVNELSLGADRDVTWQLHTKPGSEFAKAMAGGDGAKIPDLSKKSNFVLFACLIVPFAEKGLVSPVSNNCQAITFAVTRGTPSKSGPSLSPGFEKALTTVDANSQSFQNAPGYYVSKIGSRSGDYVGAEWDLHSYSKSLDTGLIHDSRIYFGLTGWFSTSRETITGYAHPCGNPGIVLGSLLAGVTTEEEIITMLNSVRTSSTASASNKLDLITAIAPIRDWLVQKKPSLDPFVAYFGAYVLAMYIYNFENVDWVIKAIGTRSDCPAYAVERVQAGFPAIDFWLKGEAPNERDEALEFDTGLVLANLTIFYQNKKVYVSTAQVGLPQASIAFDVSRNQELAKKFGIEKDLICAPAPQGFQVRLLGKDIAVLKVCATGKVGVIPSITLTARYGKSQTIVDSLPANQQSNYDNSLFSSDVVAALTPTLELSGVAQAQLNVKVIEAGLEAVLVLTRVEIPITGGLYFMAGNGRPSMLRLQGGLSDGIVLTFLSGEVSAYGRCCLYLEARVTFVSFDGFVVNTEPVVWGTNWTL